MQIQIKNINLNFGPIHFIVKPQLLLITEFFRETGSMERHAEALVTLLESCLNHNLKPSQKEEDPPHAKISSDIISCMFLVSIQIN